MAFKTVSISLMTLKNLLIYITPLRSANITSDIKPVIIRTGRPSPINSSNCFDYIQYIAQEATIQAFT